MKRVVRAGWIAGPEPSCATGETIDTISNVEAYVCGSRRRQVTYHRAIGDKDYQNSGGGKSETAACWWYIHTAEQEKVNRLVQGWTETEGGMDG